LKIGFARRHERRIVNSIEVDVANYPGTVALVGMLASEHWLRKAVPDHVDEPDWAPNSGRRQFYEEVGRRLKIDYRPGSYDPLAAWVTNERRSQLLRQAWSRPAPMDGRGVDPRLLGSK
jgi:hypothetical protein